MNAINAPGDYGSILILPRSLAQRPRSDAPFPMARSGVVTWLCCIGGHRLPSYIVAESTTISVVAPEITAEWEVEHAQPEAGEETVRQ